MKKILLGVLLGIVVITSSCVSAPPVPEAVRELQEVESPYTVIDHKYTQFGLAIPDWTYLPLSTLERDERFVGEYLYRVERIGQNLQGVQLLADNLDAGVDISREISLRVRQTFDAAESGDDELVEVYFENTVNILSETTIGGYKKYDDFWILRQHNENDEEEYIYYNLFTIDREIVESLIQRTISEQPAENETEQAARNRAQEILTGGL